VTSISTTLSLLPPSSSIIHSQHSSTSTNSYYSANQPKAIFSYTTFKNPNLNTQKSIIMPPKGAAEKKPAAKAPAEKKDAGKKTAATGEKKKRTKTRKETYSSYIYKGETHSPITASRHFASVHASIHSHITPKTFQPYQNASELKKNPFEQCTDSCKQSSSKSTQIPASPTVPCPS